MDWVPSFESEPSVLLTPQRKRPNHASTTGTNKANNAPETFFRAHDITTATPTAVGRRPTGPATPRAINNAAAAALGSRQKQQRGVMEHPLAPRTPPPRVATAPNSKTISGGGVAVAAGVPSCRFVASTASLASQLCNPLHQNNASIVGSSASTNDAAPDAALVGALRLLHTALTHLRAVGDLPFVTHMAVRSEGFGGPCGPLASAELPPNTTADDVEALRAAQHRDQFGHDDSSRITLTIDTGLLLAAYGALPGADTSASGTHRLFFGIGGWYGDEEVDLFAVLGTRGAAIRPTVDSSHVITHAPMGWFHAPAPFCFPSADPLLEPRHHRSLLPIQPHLARRVSPDAVVVALAVIPSQTAPMDGAWNHRRITTVHAYPTALESRNSNHVHGSISVGLDAAHTAIRGAGLSSIRPPGPYTSYPSHDQYLHQGLHAHPWEPALLERCAFAVFRGPQAQPPSHHHTNRHPANSSTTPAPAISVEKGGEDATNTVGGRLHYAGVNANRWAAAASGLAGLEATVAAEERHLGTLNAAVFHELPQYTGPFDATIGRTSSDVVDITSRDNEPAASALAGWQWTSFYAQLVAALAAAVCERRKQRFL